MCTHSRISDCYFRVKKHLKVRDYIYINIFIFFSPYFCLVFLCVIRWDGVFLFVT